MTAERLTNWLLTGLSAVAIAGILGGINMHADFRTMKRDISEIRADTKQRWTRDDADRAWSNQSAIDLQQRQDLTRADTRLDEVERFLERLKAERGIE